VLVGLAEFAGLAKARHSLPIDFTISFQRYVRLQNELLLCGKSEPLIVCKGMGYAT